MADEQSFIELIIASERVVTWIDAIRAGKRRAVLELRDAVERSPAYAEEACRAGAVAAATRVIATAASSQDEELLDAASAVIAACSGPMSCAGRRHEFTYGDLRVVIQEGALGDGLGAKVWGVAHTLAEELVQYPAVIQGRRVLEIGAGCGVNGIVAARLGAAEVVLTDVEGPVLENLARCAVMNAAGSQPENTSGDDSSAAKHALGTSTGAVVQAQAVISDQELFDDAEEVDDFDLGELLSGGGDVEPCGAPSEAMASVGGKAGGDAVSSGGVVQWDAGNMKVRLLDWRQSLRHLDGVEDDAASDTRNAGSTPGTHIPSVPLDDTFDVVLGNEVMYEPLHAELVAAVVAHKLAPGGACLVCCAVRDLATFKRFRSECVRRGLRCRQRQLQPPARDVSGGQRGILAPHDYEGGFVMMGVDHARAPHTHWYRDDFM